MKLTAKQEQMVREFIRETDASANSLPPTAQKRVKNTLRQRLKRELAAFGDEIPRDEQVSAILQRCRVPELSVVESEGSAAPDLAGASNLPRASRSPDQVGTASRQATSATDDTRIWAGVCSAWAERLGVEVSIVRAGFVLVGLVMPPLAFMAYVAAYFQLAVQSDDPIVPHAESGVLFLRGLSTSVQVFALFLAGHLVPRLAIKLGTSFLPELTVRLGSWGWYQGVEWRAFWFTLFLAVPMSLVAALPLLHDWDKTVGLFTRLVVALYAVVISFGIASGLVGTAIEIIAFLAQ